VLISNDDGVTAPGLVALAAALHAANCCEFAVCGPLGERSAQSHSITIHKHLHVFNISVEGAAEAFAVDGTPADSVMLALHGPVLANPNFDLVISGINRGDNCGLHVIYSGTVGAAREAACKDVPALAFSLDGYTARAPEQYAAAAAYAVAIVRATLGLLPGSVPRPLLALKGFVLNVNVPAGGLPALRGLYVATQGQHCSFPDYKVVEADPHFATANGHHHAELAAGGVTLRAFRNAAGLLRSDEREGTDSWAVKGGWVAVTPVGLVSDVPLSASAAAGRANQPLIDAVALLVRAAAAELGVEAAGVP
jgi:5'-nucleotidase